MLLGTLKEPLVPLEEIRNAHRRDVASVHNFPEGRDLYSYSVLNVEGAQEMFMESYKPFSFCVVCLLPFNFCIFSM